MTPDHRQLALNVSGGILVVATLGFLSYLCWGLVNREISLNNKDAVMMVLGVFLAKYSDLIAFFYGSSSGHKKQSETIDKLATTAAAAQEALTPSNPTVRLEPGESATVKASE